MSTKKLLALVFVLLVGAKGLSASLSYSPASPRTGETVTFTLSPSSQPVGSIKWDFGDGSPGQSGTSLTATHVYTAVGSYTAKATYGVVQSGIPVTDQATVQVTNPRQIGFTPPQPKAGQAVTFSAQNYFSSCIRWDFGDGTVKNGQTSESHTYANAGTYTVHAYEQCGTTFGASVTVSVAAQGPVPPTQPTLAVTFVNLYFGGGKAEVSVAKDFAPLQAFADIQVTGAGLLQWQWLVDGLVVKSDTMTVSFGNKFTLDSGKVPGLPTAVPGDHRVTLRFVPQPAASFAIPGISYFVAVKGPAPVVRKVTPDRLAPGSQYKLDLEGTDLTPETEISFPAPLAVVKKAVILSPTHALVTVFVAPTAAARVKEVTARNEHGQTSGPGQVTIISPQQPFPGPNPPPTTPHPLPVAIPRIMGLMDCYPDASPPYVDARVQLIRGENPDVQAVTGAVVKVDGMDLPEESPTSPTYEARLNMDLPVGHQFTVSVTVDGITYTGKGGQIDNFFRWAQPTAGTRIDQSKPDIDFQWTFNNGVAPVHSIVQYVGPLSTYPLFQTDVNSDHYAMSTSLIPPSVYPYNLNVYLTKTYAPILFEGIDASWAKIAVSQGFLQKQTWLAGGPIIVKPFPSSAAKLKQTLPPSKRPPIVDMPRPDLKFDRIWIAKSVDFPSPLPSDLLNGQTISFACTYTYSNTGFNVDKAFSIGFYIDDQLIGEKRISGLLSAETGTIFYSYTLAELGQHVYKCFIDKNKEISEANENNNSPAMNFFVYCDRPDFKLDNFYWNGPHRVKVGEIVRFVCEFSHTSGELSGPVIAKLVIDNDWSHPDVISIDHSEPGQSHKVEFSITADESGGHDVVCVVGPKFPEPYNLPDLTYNNINVDLWWTAIDPSIDKPDFQLVEISIWNNNALPRLPIDLNAIKIGTRLQLFFGANNWGLDYKGSWTVGFYIDGQLIGTRDFTDFLYYIESIGQGYDDYIVTTEGPHTYKCVLDPDNKIPELREDNNAKEITFTVVK